MGTYRYLSRDDRDWIAGMHAAGLPQRRIAEAIGKSSSTINRELWRNAVDGGGYGSTKKCGVLVADWVVLAQGLLRYRVTVR